MSELRDRRPAQLDALAAPCTSISPAARVTPAAAVRAPHRSMIRNASTAGDTRSVGRRVISSGSSFEQRFGYCRAVIAGDRVYVAGTAPIMPGDADPPAEPYEQMRRCLEIVGNAFDGSRRRLRGRRADPRLPHRRATRTGGDARTRRSVRRGTSCVHGGRLRAARRAVALRARGGGGRRDEADLSGIDHGQGQPLRRRAEAFSTTPSARATRTRSAWRRSTCCSTPRPSTSCSTSTPCSPRSPGHELEPRINPELMQSVLEVDDACLPHARRRRRAAPRASAPSSATSRGRKACASAPPARIRSRSSSGSASRRRTATARSSTSMQYIARRELIFGMHVHVAVDDAEKAIQVVNGLIGHLAELVALSASSPFWRGEPTGLRSSRHMVFAALPRSGPPPRFRELRRLRGGRRPARAHGLHRRLHAHLVGHPAASAARHDRDPDLRRGHAARGRDRDHRATARRSSSTTPSASTRRGDPRRTTASSPPRTSGSPRATGSRRR